MCSKLTLVLCFLRLLQLLHEPRSGNKLWVASRLAVGLPQPSTSLAQKKVVARHIRKAVGQSACALLCELGCIVMCVNSCSRQCADASLSSLICSIRTPCLESKEAPASVQCVKPLLLLRMLISCFMAAALLLT
jgi:hypothetical protein